MLKYVKNMFSKKSLSLLFGLLTVSGLFLGVQCGVLGEPPSKHESVLHRVGEMLQDWHYSPKPINNAFSEEVFNRYLKTLDPDRHYFFASDIEALKKYKNAIDDELLGAKLESFYAINELYVKRVNECAAIYPRLLSKPFSFTTKEYFVDDADSLSFGRNEAERLDLWRKELKYYVLDRYLDLKEQQEKNKATAKTAPKTDEALEAEAREKVKKLYDRIFERFRNRFKDDDRFHWFINDIAVTMDPHTNYYPPVEKRSFDESMSGEFYGIGASLQEEEGNIKIATIVTGSPAQKSGQIQVGDFVIKVAQGTEEPQDLTGFAVEDAVKLIRGKKGTEVRLTIRKPDGSTKVIVMIREKINLDETYAKSAVFTSSSNKKIGYIYLPEFYANFQDPTGARCATDVAKEINKLKAQKVEGIILDLRSNGGGSLMDVVQMVGFFVKTGPVVQVKSRDENPSMLKDRDDNTVLWDGPLTVMVNEFSASASEIFAAAIQDYKRGIVIGSTSTYGKGTVQRSMELDRNSWMSEEDAGMGNLKLTIQKFYRINGGSTQLKGVRSDIVLPDQYEELKYREKDMPSALGWDEIEGATYDPWQEHTGLSAVIEAANQRVFANPVFREISEQAKKLKKNSRKIYPLEMEQFKREKTELSATIKKIDSLIKLPDALVVSNLPEDEEVYKKDSVKSERNQLFLKARKNDLYIGETLKIMDEMIRQKMQIGALHSNRKDRYAARDRYPHSN